MIEIGKYNELGILRQASIGLYLVDESGEEVLLPNKYCPKHFELGDEIKVFVYLDHEERKIATNIIPKIVMHEFALLQVSAVTDVGAFMDWGMEKELLVPFREQRQKLEEGRWYVVYLDMDKETDRLYASNKINKFLQNDELTVITGDEADVLVSQKTDLGYSVIINNVHKGLIYENEVFRELNVGDKFRGYIKHIRPENKLDVSLQPTGYNKANDPNTDLVYEKLIKSNGFIAITDKSNPEAIYSEFGISKKAFKKAIGALYKQRKIKILDNGIELIEKKITS